MTLCSHNDKPLIIFAVFRSDPTGTATGGSRSNAEIIRRIRGFTPLFVTNVDDELTESLREASIRVLIVDAPAALAGFRAAPLRRRMAFLLKVLYVNARIGLLALQCNACAVQADDSHAHLSFLGAWLTRTKLLLFIRNALPARGLTWRHILPMMASHRIICISQETMATIGNELLPMLKSRLRHHYNAVTLPSESAANDFDATAFRINAGWPLHTPVALVPGFIDERKRQAELLEALEQFPCDAFHVAIVGPAKDPQAYQRCIAAVRRARASVTFHGYQSNMDPWYMAADMVALPSAAEGIPRAIIEGALAGIPAVAFDIMGCREAILNKTTGLLVSTMADFISALSALAASENTRKEFGRAAKHRALRLFEAEANIKELESKYREAVGIA